MTSSSKPTKDRVTYLRHPFLDGLSVLTASAYHEDFPVHLHDEYSLTLVQSGRETTVTPQRELTALSGSISLTPPSVLHANPNRNGSSYGFTTLYLSPDVVHYLAPKATARLREDSVVLQEPRLFAALTAWATGPHAPERELIALLEQLFCSSLHGNYPAQDSPSATEKSWLANVTEYVNQNLEDRVYLDDLATVAGMSRYHFLRSFRREKGVTPLQYVNLCRVERAKKSLLRGNSITGAAHEAGFYDQSHFHRFFLRFSGITPGQFLAGSNFVQDCN